MDYNYYINTYGGTCSNEEFETYYMMARDIVGMYIYKNVAKWNYSDDLVDDPLLYQALSMQLDFLKSTGGIDGMMGSGALALTEVSTSGYRYTYDRTNIKNNMILDGLPFSPLARFQVKMFLSKKGLTYRGIV